MDEIKNRLVNCFKLVFPDLPEGEIAEASQTTIAGWDSVAAITLMNVLEDEFLIEMDFDRLAELDAFPKILNYLSTECTVAQPHSGA